MDIGRDSRSEDSTCARGVRRGVAGGGFVSEDMRGLKLGRVKGDVRERAAWNSAIHRHSASCELQPGNDTSGRRSKLRIFCLADGFDVPYSENTVSEPTV